MRIITAVLLLVSISACAATRDAAPLSINSPKLDSGISGTGGGGLGGERTVGRSTSGVINRVTVP